MKCKIPECGKPAVATVHDRRGCHDLCVRHTQQRLQQSFAFVFGDAGCSCGKLHR